IRERYVCLLSDRHPRIGTQLSLEQFLAEHLYAVFAVVFVLAAGCLLLLRPAPPQAQAALA
ncbi:hypothetical protein HUS96_27200, partial [Pseudomonas protegens]|nr:hypothetical protein [Pseudomonas protegens]